MIKINPLSGLEPILLIRVTLRIPPIPGILAVPEKTEEYR